MLEEDRRSRWTRQPAGSPEAAGAPLHPNGAERPVERATRERAADPMERLVAIFRVHGRETPELALELAHSGLQVIDRAWNDVATVILDALKPQVVALCLPGLDRESLHVAAEVRSRTNAFVVAIVPAGGSSGILQALRMGADVCFRDADGWAVIAEEIRGLLERSVALQGDPITAPPSAVTVGGLRIDAGRHEVTIDGQEVRLTRTEFRVLWKLAGSAGRVVPAIDAMQAANSDVQYDDGEARNLLKVYVRRLRQKMGRHGELIVTVRAEGYMLDPRREVREVDPVRY